MPQSGNLALDHCPLIACHLFLCLDQISPGNYCMSPPHLGMQDQDLTLVSEMAWGIYRKDNNKLDTRDCVLLCLDLICNHFVVCLLTNERSREKKNVSSHSRLSHFIRPRYQSRYWPYRYRFSMCDLSYANVAGPIHAYSRKKQ